MHGNYNYNILKGEVIMRRKGRKEVTKVKFIGVASDGGFVFKASVLLPNIGGNLMETKKI